MNYATTFTAKSRYSPARRPSVRPRVPRLAADLAPPKSGGMGRLRGMPRKMRAPRQPPTDAQLTTPWYV